MKPAHTEAWDWITKLPEVGPPTCAQAAQLSTRLHELRQQEAAYRELAAQFMNELREDWTDAEIKQARGQNHD